MSEVTSNFKSNSLRRLRNWGIGLFISGLLAYGACELGKDHIRNEAGKSVKAYFDTMKSY